MFYLLSHVVHINPTKHALSSGVVKDGRLSSFMLTHEAGMETQYSAYN